MSDYSGYSSEYGYAKKSRKIYPYVIGIVATLLIGGGVAAYFFLGGMSEEEGGDSLGTTNRPRSWHVELRELTFGRRIWFVTNWFSPEDILWSTASDALGPKQQGSTWRTRPTRSTRTPRPSKVCLPPSPAQSSWSSLS